MVPAMSTERRPKIEDVDVSESIPNNSKIRESSNAFTVRNKTCWYEKLERFRRVRLRVIRRVARMTIIIVCISIHTENPRP